MLAGLELLLSTATDGETAERGYVITGDESYLGPQPTRPDTPVLMLTGWGRQLVMKGELPPHVDRVLSKPVRLRELREAFAEGRGGREPQRR
ncbi:MAG: hypothetical protein E6K26_03365 [Gammaproteobacteria bacterium]|nr:MAG: hypothetical protein E6K26_03365 [Gammaproteobacteria bacterium]